jgi:REP element-mobilizing transposase RayT
MPKTLGYMLTFTTYGTWLQGDERGYVKNGRIHSPNDYLVRTNKCLQVQDAVRLSKIHQQLVQQAIVKEAALQGQHIYALAIKPTHIHIVLPYSPQPISKIVAYYKKAARVALQEAGHNGRVWTKGYDKRFCFDNESLKRRINYVNGQNST